jgi:hypothetical protein
MLLITGDPKLKAFKLSDEQWALAEELRDVLNVGHLLSLCLNLLAQCSHQIFKGPTLLFSQSEVPLVSNTIPMLQEVEESLEIVRDHTDMPAVIRIAAHAGLLLAQKYHSMNDECEVYRIAIGNTYLTTVISVLLFGVLTISTAMCLDKKLQWFVDHDWSPASVEEIRQQVIDRWTTSYKPLASVAVNVTPAVSANAPIIVRLLLIFTGNLLTISIQAWLSMETAPKTEVNTYTRQY